MLSIAACTSYQSIVGSQKYLRTAPFCAGEMQCIVDAESQCLQFICPIDYRLLYKYAFGYLRRQYLNPPPAFQIRRLLNLEVKYLTSYPPPLSAGHMSKDEKNSFGFQSDVILRLIVERPIQTARIKVNYGHWEQYRTERLLSLTCVW